ncbi:MAG: DNA alkylation repair protein [Bacteroidales bacterium OttesenSCG-928-I14]|jgi:3-methyladenine DNA glycosylase AlkD|nr:DNA alkylation repair protein [Bacteroidales bacterium OttesenSCG-928-I14]
MNVKFFFDKISSNANPEKSKIKMKYFKIKQGQCEKNDIMLGVSTPTIRNLVKEFDLYLPEIQTLLYSKYHEIRLAGLLFLVKIFSETKNELEREEIFNFYIKNTHKINNWDLVDVSCYKIIGLHLLNKKNRNILYKLAYGNLWEQRISIVSTMAFIKNQQFDDTLALAEKLLINQNDLIHKAVGWMLREIGKRNFTVLVDFLEKKYKQMPRTMLRYSIELFSPERRRYFMKK